MSAEVSCSLGFPEGAGKVDTTEANGRPHGFETAGGEAIKPTSFHTNLVDLIEGCSRDNKVPQTL